MTVLPYGRVAFRGFEEKPLPHVCPLRATFDMNCMVCGLTRSTIYLVHFRWNQAWHSHRLGWLSMLLIVFQIPYRLSILYSRKIKSPGRFSRMAFGYSIVGIFLINWIVNLLT
jgi:hypothetical protein